MKPYIGITGFMEQWEVGNILKIFTEEFSRKLMIGVLVSWKTLAGQKNKYPKRYPRIERVAYLFPDSSKVVNLIHYNAKKSENLNTQLFLLTNIGGKNLHGFQLNMVWPEISELKKYLERYGDMRIVLQINNRAFEMIGNSPHALAKKVSDYEGFITDILLDLSEGKGKLTEPEDFRGYLRAIKDKCPNIGLGIAGGLAPDTVLSVSSLLNEFPDLNIDAEGRLRDENDDLDIWPSTLYITEALRMFAK